MRIFSFLIGSNVVDLVLYKWQLPVFLSVKNSLHQRQTFRILNKKLIVFITHNLSYVIATTEIPFNVLLALIWRNKKKLRDIVKRPLISFYFKVGLCAKVTKNPHISLLLLGCICFSTTEHSSVDIFLISKNDFVDRL